MSRSTEIWTRLRKGDNNVKVKRMVLVGTGLILAVAMTVGFMPAASAASYPSRISGSAGFRDCTNVSLSGCAERGKIPNETPVRMSCWIDDSNVTGRYTSNRWFFVTASTGVRAFVHSSYVTSQTGTSNCKEHRGVAASRWAAMQIGETVPSSAEKGANKNMDRWTGWCYVLAWDAYALSTGVKPYSGYGSAKRTYDAYKRNGRINTNLDPKSISIGAIVFWPNSSDWGHAAIYVGNGYVASTMGLYPEKKANARVRLSYFGTPAGFVAPSNV